jgi:hypothetical protein
VVPAKAGMAMAVAATSAIPAVVTIERMVRPLGFG